VVQARTHLEVSMQFEIFTGSAAQTQADCLVIGVHESGTLSAVGAGVDRQSGGKLSKLLKSGDFPGRLGETLLMPAFPKMKATRVLLVGQGKAEVTRKAWRKAFQAAIGAHARPIASSTIISSRDRRPRSPTRRFTASTI
jgi:leucyl aminopeptidase